MAKTTLEQWDETAANNSDTNSINIAEECVASNINNAIRENMAQTAAWLGDDTLASGTTTDLGSVPGRYVTVSGTTTITGLGTIKAGTIKYVTFSGALTLTHNATSLILPGAANITTAAGDAAVFVSEGSGNWRCLGYQRGSVAPGPGQHIQCLDVKTSGTTGGAASAGATATRTLNSESANTIPGASLTSNAVSLPEGTYWIDASAPAYAVNFHKLVLYNVTASAVSITGTSEYSDASSSNVVTRSFVQRQLVVPSGGQSFELRHYTQSANANGLGLPTSMSGVAEVYSSFIARKLQ